jgi:hypothetical protein
VVAEPRHDEAAGRHIHRIITHGHQAPSRLFNSIARGRLREAALTVCRGSTGQSQLLALIRRPENNRELIRIEVKLYCYL